MKEERCEEYFICNNCGKEMESYKFAIYFNKQNLMIDDIDINFCDDFHFCSKQCMVKGMIKIMHRAKNSLHNELNLQGLL